MPKAKILIVEDDLITAKDIDGRLHYLGYEVNAIVSSDSEALFQITKNPPDLVLVDVKLQDKMDGIEVADQILTKIDIPVVYLIALTDEATLSRIKKTESFGFVTKPFDSRELQGVIEAALYKHGMEKKLRESEARLFTTLRSISDAVIATDTSGKITFMNPVAEELTGMKEKESGGKPLKRVFKIINEDTGKPVENPFKRILKEGKGAGLANPTVLIANDGSKTHINYSGSPIRGDKGNIIGVVLTFKDISERKRAEEALRVRESAIASSINSIAFADLEGNLIYVNPSFLELWGYDDDKEILGNSTLLFWQLEDKAAEVIEALRDKGSWIGELVATRKDHSLFDVQLSANMVMDEGDKPICVMASFMAISERKQVEKSLTESETKYRMLFSNIADPVVIFDKETHRFLDCNQSALERYGYTLDELRTMTPHQLHPSDELEEVDKHIDDKEDISPHSYTHITKKGERLFVEIHTTEVEYDGREAWISIIRDITERVQTEEVLRRLGRAVESASDAIGMADMTGKSIYHNDAFVELLGYTVDELNAAGGPPVVYKYPNVAREVFGTITEGGSWSGEVGMKTRTGHEVLVFLRANCVKDDNNRITGLVGIHTDITERVQAEEQIQKDLKEKEILLKEIHHRVKNNLQIVGSLLGLQAKHIKDKQALEMFEESRNRVRSMALVHENLYRSKDFANINFAKYIKNLTDQLVKTYIIDSGKIELDVKVEDVCTGIDQAIPCGLVINELVSNALKHAFPPSLKRKGKIEIAVHSMEADEIELTVKDNGVGIPKELDIRKTESLGLKLVTILAEDQLDGKVTLDRSGGTKFTIRFKQKNS